MAGSITSTLHSIITPVPVWVVAAWLIALTIVIPAYRTYKNPLSKLPGPSHSKWTSIVDKYYYVRGHRHDYVQSLHEKYGPFSPPF